MFPFDELNQLYRLFRLDGVQEWYAYQDATPSHRFMTALKWFPTKELCCEFSIRDDYPDDLLIKLTRFTDTQVDSLSCEKQITKISNSQQGIHFTTVVYINHECHNSFKYQIPSLQPKTLVAFPSFDCEFSGDETPVQISCMRGDFVSTVDWNRKPVPKVLMRYANHRTKSKSTRKKLGLTRMEILINEIKNLKESPESFVELENFRHQKCLIMSKGETNHLSFGDLELSTNDTVNFATRFIYEGMKGTC
jgi:hypothetical protein